MSIPARRGVAAKPAFGPGRKACEPQPDLFFPTEYTPKSTAEAKQLCRSCPFRRSCAEWVAGHEQADGVYAAMAPKEREGLADRIAAADGDVARMLRLFDDREAVLSAQRIGRSVITRAVAVRIVGAAELERAQLVRRYTPELVDKVLAGEVSLRDAAGRAWAVADAPTKRKVAA